MLLDAHNLYFVTALKTLNEIIEELGIEQEMKDCLETIGQIKRQQLIRETIVNLVRIEKEKCKCNHNQ